MPSIRNDSFAVPEVVAVAPVMQRLLAEIAQVAQSNTTVLLVGETGTGKEVFAKTIHASSRRASRSFVPINCAALPESLIETELFGHARGAFTGSTGEKAGLFEEASGGTLFLDEVGELPLASQARLLRALEERRIRRIGDNREREVDVRVVAATNRDLGVMVEEGRFRRDLLYRLQVVRFDLPPLRERKEDLPLLASRLLSSLCMKQERTCTLTEDAIERLCLYDWPGNVRELRNFIEELLARTPGEVIDGPTVAARLPRTEPRPRSGNPLDPTRAAAPTKLSGGKTRHSLGLWRFTQIDGEEGSFYVRPVVDLESFDETRELPDSGQLRIGRDGAQAELVLPTGEVSRLHLTITVEQDEIAVEDHGSRNGTFVDGEPITITARRALPPGSVLRLGKEWVGLLVDVRSNFEDVRRRCRLIADYAAGSGASRIEVKAFEQLMASAGRDRHGISCVGDIMRRGDEPPVEEGITAATLTAEQILRACEACGGNKRATARRLGISQTTLYERIKAFGLESAPCWTSSRKNPAKA